MPRTPRSLDPASGPVQAFASELRKLWEQAGRPKYLQMARRTGKSRTAMSEAAGGDVLPTWETVTAFVTACSADPNDWRQRWEQARDARATMDRKVAKPDVAVGAAVRDLSVGVDTALDAPQSWRMRWILPYVVLCLATAIVVAAVTTIIIKSADRSGNGYASTVTQRHLSAAVITVQNKVALGPNTLTEDTTPAYLSSRPIPYCSHYNCEVPGTQVSSGAMLVAVCYTHGVEMYNYNLDSAASEDNPYRASSSLWYRVVFPRGQSGYISAVYIVAADRDGMALSTCDSRR
jgi:hypothetical protein